MSAIEFSAQAGKTFSVQLYDATTGATIGSPIAGVVDNITPTRYRASTGTNSGIVYVVATTTNLRVAGYADLDNPPANSTWSPLAESLDQVGGGEVNLTVLPSQVQQNPRSKASTLKLYVGETISVSHQVLDPSGQPVTLTGMTLLLVFEDRHGNEIASVTPTISGSTFNAVIPSSVTIKSGRPMTWALRNRGVGGGNAVVGEGAVEVQYAPGGAA